MSQIELDFSTWPVEGTYDGYTATADGVVTLTTAGSSDTPQIYKITALPHALTSATQYIVIGAEHITLDGNSKIVTVTVTDYPGFVENGKMVDGTYDSTTGTYTRNNDIPAHGGCTIKNLSVDGTNGSLSENSGWVCQQNFGGDNSGEKITVENCNSSGTISQKNSGGIFGTNTNAVSEKELIVLNCYSTGAISGDEAGGIFANRTNFIASGTITVTNCYSSGTISGKNTGGIFGLMANYHSSGTITVTNCYSSGTISGNYAGGIFGDSANRDSNGGTITVTECYSLGSISGEQAGGIIGDWANVNAGIDSTSKSFNESVRNITIENKK